MTLGVLDALSRLVAFDTRNPPRALHANSKVFDFLREHFEGSHIEIIDEGEGSVSFLAVRGQPETLFNFHIDTVPVAEGWTRDPFKLRVADGRATGLGACDIKGALAAMLAASSATKGDLAVLVTTDEEAGNSQCIRKFVARRPDFKRVIVAEPTGCRAVRQHRGILSGRVTFGGVAGHASEARAIHDNANHRLMNWGSALQSVIQGAAQGDALHDLRLNIGRIEGGIKPNMIAASATAAFNLRTPPGADHDAIIDALDRISGAEHIDDTQYTFVAPALPSAAATTRADVSDLNIEVAEPVDFWTEAALFDAAGYPAVVIGSGDIAQAHTADEWVATDDLEKLNQLYTQWIDHG
ncbi:MAG: acetylornithine deacetylase [Pseudomonadota bacterium]